MIEEQVLLPNTVVYIHSLQKNVEMNHSVGIVIEHVPIRGRYRIRFHNGKRGLLWARRKGRSSRGRPAVCRCSWRSPIARARSARSPCAAASRRSGARVVGQEPSRGSRRVHPRCSAVLIISTQALLLNSQYRRGSRYTQY